MAISSMTTTTRRWLYGFNVAITTLLAILLVALIIWAAGRYGGRMDWTSSGVNSLNPRTQKLLEGLKEPINITGLYSTALKEVRPFAEKHKNRVSDLLDLYQTAGRGKVSTFMLDSLNDQAKVNELLKRLREKPAYKDEAKPHAEALTHFPDLNGKIATLAQKEYDDLENLIQTDQVLQKVQPVAIIARNLRFLLNEAQNTEADVKKLQEGEIPQYGQAVQIAHSYLQQTLSTMQEAVDWMTRNQAQLGDIGEEAKTFLAGANQRYTPILTEVRELAETMKDLGRVKIEDLYDSLKRDQTILVENDKEAIVLSNQEVWPYRTNRDLPPPPDGDETDFAGEQAISSAILKLTTQTRTAVIFTRYGGMPLLTSPRPSNPMQMQQMPKAPYQEIRDLLEKENFIAQEWDVGSEAEPPKVEEASRYVYVVFPPEPPQQQMNPMQPPPTPRINTEQKQEIFDAVKNSGMAIFLTPWLPPASQYMPTPEKCEFTTYLKDNWGIGVEDEHLTWQFVVQPQRNNLMIPANRNLMIDSSVFHFTDQPIGNPLKGMPCAFQSAVPLRILPECPQGVTVEPIAEMNETDDAWALTDIARFSADMRNNQGTKRYEEDIPTPFPVAVAAQNADGAKLVVFASDTFISDNVLDMPQMVMVGGTVRFAKLYPGNPDLFINAIHWLTGNADRIAVGAQQSDVPRLSRLKEGNPVLFTRVFLIGVWPALALLAGLVVWIVRRR